MFEQKENRIVKMNHSIDLNRINLETEPPAEEPERQYFFIEKARQYVAQMAQEAGRSLTFCVNTFGCPKV